LDQSVFSEASRYWSHYLTKFHCFYLFSNKDSSQSETVNFKPSLVANTLHLL